MPRELSFTVRSSHVDSVNGKVLFVLADEHNETYTVTLAATLALYLQLYPGDVLRLMNESKEE